MLRPLFRLPMRNLTGAMAAAVVLGVAACAPTNPNPNTTHTGADIGRTQSVSYGVIVSMRPVTVQAEQAGGGTLGAAPGSYVGRNDVRADILGALGGATPGGVAGAPAGKAVATGSAMEFIIHEDSGKTISVVQTNEDNFQPGERVALTFGERARIGRIPG